MIIFLGFFGNDQEREKLKKLQDRKEKEELNAMFSDGLRLLKLKQYEAAREYLLNALKACKQKDGTLNYQLIYNIALSFFYEQNYSSAISYFDKCLGTELSDGDKVNAFLYKGVSMVKKGDLNNRLRKQALELFSKVIEVDNRDVDAWYLKGCMEFELGETKASIESFDKVIELDKDYENVYDINLFYEVWDDKVGDNVEEHKDGEVKQEQGAIVLDPKDIKTEIKTSAGLVVNSEAEQRIADFLSGQGLEFQYRPTVALGNSSFLTGFYVPKFDLFLEHFPGDDFSKVDMDRKINLCNANNKKFVFTTSDDGIEIEKILAKRLIQFKKRKTSTLKNKKNKK